jgi:iron complex outermembrane receptor protein
MQKIIQCTVSAMLFSTLFLVSELNAKEMTEIQNNISDIENLEVRSVRIFQDTTIVSPTSKVGRAELDNMSMSTVEDALAHEPSLVVRKRFIGDPNGVIGIRSSNMFQGTHSLVFADGMPLHYHLQTRWNGSPRWSLVTPSEVESVEVFYGPFSAEYSGNAMGGVVDITTRTPQSKRVVLEGALFSQNYQLQDQDERFNGGKVYLSYEDKIDNLAFLTSFQRLQNDSHPLSQYTSAATLGAEGMAVSGGIKGINELGSRVVYYGDSGTERATTDLYKLKLNYDLGRYQLRSTIAYENRLRAVKKLNNFVHDEQGNVLWSGLASVAGTQFTISNSNFQQSEQQRDSLLIGLGLSGDIAGSDWLLDGFYSHFEILDDHEVLSAVNPDDPSYASANASFGGRLTEYDGSGWQTFEFKLGTQSLFDDPRQRLSVGLHADQYTLKLVADDYDAIAQQRDSDETDGNAATGRSDSNGEAQTQALFAQYGFKLYAQWDLALGLRYEDWQTRDGFSGGLNIKQRDAKGFSPKFSLGYFPAKDITLRYSVAKAIRFPILEELYRNDDATSSGSVFVSNPNLVPELGVFHNVSIEHIYVGGALKLNLFYEQIEDVIYDQSTTTNVGTVTTSLPTEQVTNHGTEFIWQAKGLWQGLMDVRFNLSYLDAKISKNVLNPAIVGNVFPRSPKWRSNLQLHFPLSETVDVNLDGRCASNSYGRLDNLDTTHQVFGAQDDYLLLGLKANWQFSQQLRLSAGIDNLTNQEAYVAHPWPQRTYYLEAKYLFEGDK